MERSFLRVSVLVGILATQAACTDLLGFGDDDEPPVLESTTPADGAAEVSVLEALRLRFSTDIDLVSATDGIRLEVAGRALVVEASLADDRTLLLTPTDPLDFGTEYQVVVTPTLRSTSGVPVAGTPTRSFSTEGLPPPVPSQDTLRRHLEALAHDSMRGRWSGTEDELKAARYLEDRFLAYGLQAPVGGAIQPFEAYSRRQDTTLSSRNVMAMVPGSGSLSQEWLVVGAHYDHIGFRNLEDESSGPNNGADDNGSGTVLMLETARLLQRYVEGGGMAGVDRRSVLFIGFGAEEEGLLGSCHYVQVEPVVPLSRTRAMMNFDMVGRLRNDMLRVSGQETAYAWPPMVINANAPELFLTRPEISGGGTDHVCFWQAGIPWVGFFTDFHDEYHRPEDDVALINFRGMERVGELGFRILTRLLVAPMPPEFVPPAGALGFTPMK